MTTADLATQLIKDAIALRSTWSSIAPREAHDISQHLEEAAARLDVLASLEREYEKGKLR